MTCHRRLVHGAERHTGPGRREACVGGFAHRLVDAPLHVAEAAVHRERAGDVGRVQAVDLDARVDEDEVAGRDDPVVARPVQEAGVRSGCRDRVVPDRVAVAARPAVEDAFDDALAARVLEHAGQLADDVVESVRGHLDGEAHLVDLVVVLDQSQLGDGTGEIGVLVDDEIAVTGGELVDVPGREPEVACNARKGRPRADPELADRGIRVELARGAVRALAEVQGDLVSAARERLEDEHRTGLGVGGPAGQVRERRVRAEVVVGVVAALLERTGRNHEALPGERCRERRATRGGERRLFALRRCRIGAFGPAGGDRLEEAVAVRLAPVGRRRGALGGLGCEGVAFACRAHGSSLALRVAHCAGSSCTMSGRWSLPEPSSERSTMEPVALQ